MADKLSHYDDSGRARMVDVSGKAATRREAEASAFVLIKPEVLQALPQNPDASPAPNPAGEVSPTPTPIKRSLTGEPGDPALNTSNSFWLDNYPLNDLYQYLARQADYQLSHETAHWNSRIREVWDRVRFVDAGQGPGGPVTSGKALPSGCTS